MGALSKINKRPGLNRLYPVNGVAEGSVGLWGATSWEQGYGGLPELGQTTITGHSYANANHIG